MSLWVVFIGDKEFSRNINKFLLFFRTVLQHQDFQITLQRQQSEFKGDINWEKERAGEFSFPVGVWIWMALQVVNRPAFGINDKKVMDKNVTRHAPSCDGQV